MLYRVRMATRLNSQLTLLVVPLIVETALSMTHNGLSDPDNLALVILNTELRHRGGDIHHPPVV